MTHDEAVEILDRDYPDLLSAGWTAVFEKVEHDGRGGLNAWYWRHPRLGQQVVALKTARELQERWMFAAHASFVDRNSLAKEAWLVLLAKHDGYDFSRPARWAYEAADEFLTAMCEFSAKIEGERKDQ